MIRLRRSFRRHASVVPKIAAPGSPTPALSPLASGDDFLCFDDPVLSIIATRRCPSRWLSYITQRRYHQYGQLLDVIMKTWRRGMSRPSLPARSLRGRPASLRTVADGTGCQLRKPLIWRALLVMRPAISGCRAHFSPCSQGARSRWGPRGASLTRVAREARAHLLRPYPRRPHILDPALWSGWRPAPPAGLEPPARPGRPRDRSSRDSAPGPNSARRQDNRCHRRGGPRL